MNDDDHDAYYREKLRRAEEVIPLLGKTALWVFIGMIAVAVIGVVVDGVRGLWE